MSAVEAVERLAGMQAQEPKPPFAGLWTRVEGFRRDDLRDALRERAVVRGMLMRATLHLVSARDYAAFRAPLQPVMTQAMRGALRGRDEGLELERVLPAAQALFDERPRGFKELRALLAERFPGVNERALGYAVRTHLALVMVPTEDRWAFPAAADFTPAAAWLGRPIADDEAPRALVERYLAAFGPASAADFQTWSGLQRAKEVVEEMRPDLVAFLDERGREVFDLPDAPRPDEDMPAPARLLPEFDNLMLAHDDRSRVVADEHRPQVVTKNLRVRATFLHDGFVRGTWRSERKGRKATLRIEPFATLGRRALDEVVTEGEAMLRFLEDDAGSFDVEVD